MLESLWFVLGALLVGGLAGFLVGHFKSARTAAQAAAAGMRADQFERQVRALDEERRHLLDQSRELTGALATERERLSAFEESRAALKNEMENLATTILEDKSRRFTEQNRTQLAQLLGPLDQRLKEFRSQIQEAYGKENEARAALGVEVRQLSQLNQTVSREASNLTQALKGQAKTRGNWGEMLLQTVLEKSGLVPGQHFHTQVSETSEAGRRLQPDVVIDLPGARQVIIDAKVSLVAYERQCHAATEEERLAAAKEHADAVRRHISQLSDKNYAALPGLNSPDFVLLFVPIEPALQAALETAPDLIEFALQRNIILATAPNLVATARLVAQLWQQDSQNRHARQIAEQGGKLYDKFVAFCRDLENIGLRLRQTQESYDAAMNKLRTGRGNLVGQTEKLRTLGAKTTAQPLELIDAGEDGEE